MIRIPWQGSVRIVPYKLNILSTGRNFLTDTSFNTNNEDLKKELQTIHGRFLHIDPLKWFQESASEK